MLITIFVLSFFGFLISGHIWRSKKTKHQLSCVIGRKDSCDIVVNSKYNALFGISNEVNGMLYYGFVMILSLALFFGYEEIARISLRSVLLVIGGLAAVFSVFLTVIQALALKQWCEWCLGSAFLSICIFALEALAFY